MKTAKFVKLDQDAIIPQYKTDHSAGADVSILEDVTIEAHSIELCRTGLVCVPPHGCYWEVYARSSLPLKHNLTLANNVGIIDPDYCGPKDELKVMLYNFSDFPVKLEKGTRVAQLVLRKHNQCHMKERANTLFASRGGFGSTGI